MTTSGVRRVLLLLWISLTGPAILPATGQLWERYIDGYHGPYRGRIIDAETKAPLAGVVVVGVWQRDVTSLLHSRMVVHRVKEVLTEKDGTFVLHAKELEENAPEHTLHPYFVVFLPGYTVFQGVYERRFQGAGATLELRRLKSWAERNQGGANVYPHTISNDPFRDLPQLMRLINDERIARGLRPYPRPEEK